MRAGVASFREQISRGVVATLLLLPHLATAQSWLGGGGDDNWNNAGNWSGSTVPPSADTTSVTFDTASSYTPFVNDPWTINALTFKSAGYAISGAPLTFAGTSPTLDAAASGCTITSDVLNTASGLTISVAGPGALTLSGTLGGPGALAKTGSGTLTLLGTMGLAGTTTVSDGTLALGDGFTGPSAVGRIANNGSVVFNAFVIDVNDLLSGAGTVTVEAGAFVRNVSSGPFTHQGATTLYGQLEGVLNGSINNNAPLFIAPSGRLNTTNGAVGSLSGSGILDIWPSSTFTAGGDNSTTTFTGSMGSVGNFVKAGSGTLTLAPAGWPSGTVTVQAPGTLRIGDGINAPYAVNALVAHGALVFHPAVYLEVAGSLSGTGSVTVEAGTFVRNVSSGPFTHQGATTLFGQLEGVLNGSINNNAPLFIGPSGRLNTTNGAVGSLSGSGILDIWPFSTFTAGGDNSTTTFTGSIGSVGNFVKAGSGTLTLAPAGWPSGTVTVQAPGTLRIGDGINAPYAVNALVAHGALVFHPAVYLEVAGSLSGTGSVTVEAGTFVRNVSSGPFTHQGATTLYGQLEGVLNGSINNNAPLFIAPSGRLNTTNGAVGSLSGSGILDIWPSSTFTAGGDNSTTTFTGSIGSVGNFVKAGSGTLTLAPAGWPSGTVTVQAPGTLRIGDGINAPYAVNALVAHGALVFHPAVYLEVAGSLSGTGSVTVEAGTFVRNVSSGPFTHQGATTLYGQLEGVLNGSINNNAPLFIAPSGRLNTSNGAVGSLSGSGILDIWPFSTFTVGGDNSTTTFSGTINVGGSFAKAGTGTLTLSGSSGAFGGSLLVNAGTLRVTGTVSAGSITVAAGATLAGTGTVAGPVSVNPGGSLSPGLSPGILNTGNLSLTGTLHAEILGATAGTQYDQVNVTGTVAINDGTLLLSGAYVPAAGNTFVLINNDGTDPVAGTFSGLAEGDTFTVNGALLRISYAGGTGNDVVLSHATFTVTPSVNGGNGTISPSSAQPVAHGATVAFAVIPAAGYAASIGGTCPAGSLIGTTYTTGAITANCTVVASFTLNTYTVTPSVVGAHGTLSPTAAQTVNHGATATFTVTPDPAYGALVFGTCGGTLVGSTYTTDPITASCTVEATFELVDPPRLGNISTRMQVLTGNDVMIGGFIITGASSKTVVVRARGPSLVPFGITNALANPQLRLVRSSDQVPIADNDDWQSAANTAAITASGFAPSNDLESALLVSLAPGAYTAIVSGAGNTTGVGIVEVFEVDQPLIPLSNISTRGRVFTGNDVMIGGFIIGGSGNKTVVVRARGPSLSAFGVPGVLANPHLQLVRASDQAVLATNDSWIETPNAAALVASGFAPSESLEAAIIITLPPGAYTAIVSGVGDTAGVAIVEVFAVD